MRMKEEESFFALSWPVQTDNVYHTFAQEDIYNSYCLWTHNVQSDPKQEAQNMKDFLETIPEGKKGAYIEFAKLVLDETYQDNYLWYDEGVKAVKDIVGSVFEEYASIGGKIDYITIDMELTPMSTNDLTISDSNMSGAIMDDERYTTDIRPLLAERGYQFCDVGHLGQILGLNELYTITDSPNKEIWNKVMENRVAEYLNEAICDPILTYYPDIKISNYNYHDGDGWHKVPHNSGLKYYLGGSSVKVGTHSNISCYGNLGWIVKPSNGSVSNAPEDYYGETYDGTKFHSLLFDNNRLRKAWLSDENKQIQAWVTTHDLNYSQLSEDYGYANSPYYAENIFHTGLLNPEPFLFFGYTGNTMDDISPTEAEKQERADELSSLLGELNEVAGYSDRRPLVDGLSSWNDRYLLSGMYANGRNIWRITPDLTVENMELESFCIDENTPTFYIDGKTITFPQGEIHIPTTQNNTCGYWVVTPENVEPVVTYDKRTEQGSFGASMLIYRADNGIVTTNIPADCGMTARVSFNNLTINDENLTLFMASYKGNELTDVKILSKKTAYSGEDNIILVEDIQKPADDTTRVSFYLFGDNLQPFVPLTTLLP